MPSAYNNVEHEKEIYIVPWGEALLRGTIQWFMVLIFFTLLSVILAKLDNSSTTLPDGSIEYGTLRQIALGLITCVCCLSPILVTFGSFFVAGQIRLASGNDEVSSLFHIIRIPWLYNALAIHVDKIFMQSKKRSTHAFSSNSGTVATKIDYGNRLPSELSVTANTDGLPENIIHDYIVDELIDTFGYPSTDIEIEFSIRMGSSSKRADVVIFNRGASHVQENIVAIIECKKMLTSSVSNTRLMNEGENQLKSYMASCINARFGAVAGAEWKAFELVKGYSGNAFHEISQFPSATGMNVAFQYAPR